MTVAGNPVPHESARGHVTGSALYTDDLLTRFPNLLHAWPVTAPHAHARVTSLDAAPALAEPGVVTTLIAADAPGEADSGPSRHDEPLFPAEVMFHRQPVAWVLGETLEAAQRGAARVRVEYEPLAAILTIPQAIEANSFLTDVFRLSRGDVSAIERSPLRIDGELSIGGQEHFYLETQAAIAWIDETGGVVAQSSTQHPAETQEIYRDGTVQVNHGGTEMGQGLFTKIRQIAADALGVDPDRIRLIATRTDKVPNTSATAASAGTDLNGAAVADACQQLKARLDEVAAKLGLAPSAVEGKPGWLTLEELLWDDHGQLATAGASTYELPSWSEVPEDFRVSFLQNAAQSRVIFGSKAIGEPPLMLAISVREALREAVAAFGAGEVVTFDSPATPGRIFFAVRQVRARLRALRFGGQVPAERVTTAVR